MSSARLYERNPLAQDMLPLPPPITRSRGPMDRISDDDGIKEVLADASTIAVVGMKSGTGDDAYRIPAYMQEHGYRIIPVNPKLRQVLDAESYPDLAQIPQTLHPIDIVNIFRATEHLPAHVDEILAL